MNEETVAGRWKQVRRHAKEWWGQLTDDELARIEGKKDKLVGALQAKYGYTKEQAESEIDRPLRSGRVMVPFVTAVSPPMAARQRAGHRRLPPVRSR